MPALSRPFGLLSIFLILQLGYFTAHGQDQELTILSIEGDLIAPLAEETGDSDPEVLIERYYEKLGTGTARRLRTFFTELGRLSTEYNIAFNAADTAEVNELVEDTVMVWARIRTLHARHFNAEATQQLLLAYETLFPLVAPD